MDRRNVLYPYNEILFDNKKEWRNYICYHMDEPQKLHAKLKKPVRKDWFHLHKISRTGKSTETESRVGCQG